MDLNLAETESVWLTLSRTALWRPGSNMFYEKLSLKRLLQGFGVVKPGLWRGAESGWPEGRIRSS